MSICLLSSLNPPLILLFFFFNDTATTEIYTLSLHDALPISACGMRSFFHMPETTTTSASPRSEEHTSELQSRSDLVCRLLLEKTKKSTTKTQLAHVDIAYRHELVHEQRQ